MTHASPTNLAEAIAFYAAHHLPATAVKKGDKAGRISGWSQPGHNAKPSDYRLDDNIAPLNGTQPVEGSYFIDIDIDAKSPREKRIIQRLLPPTGWRYGRAGNPES